MNAPLRLKSSPNEFEFVEGALVKIFMPGYHTVIDRADFELVRPYCWRAKVSTKTPQKVYVATRVRDRYIWMHKLILGIGLGEMGDHRNGDSLDNRRSNLRRANSLQNAVNRRGKQGRSGFRGVTIVKTKVGVRFCAAISICKANRHIGTFETAEKAALAYDAVSRELHGEFAVLNFPQAAQC